MESRESSSPKVTRSVAAALSGQYIEGYEFPAYQRILLRLLGRLPQQSAQWLIPRAQAPSALDLRQVWNLSVERLAQTRLDDYRALPGRFRAVTAGIALGGTTAHLSTLLGGPFLPQAFVLTLKGGAENGDARAYFRRSAELARHLVEAHPEIMTIQHYDPVHDGWLTRRVNHVRVKLVDLPEAYRQFLREKLEPGGEVVYLEGGARWLRYRTGERSVFQVGGWGDISAQEFLEGSDRIRRYCQREGLTEQDWRLPDFPLEEGPESEWGSEPGLGEALEQFCAKEGYRFLRIAMPDPNDFSRLAYYAYLRALEMEGRQPAGVVVEMFSQYDASAVMQCGLVPLWLIFNTLDSLAFLREMAPRFPSGVPLFFSPLSTFSLTPDMVPWQDWEAALDGRAWINIGARRSHYPADALALVDGMKPLRTWCGQHNRPVQARLSGARLAEIAAQLNGAGV